MKIIIDINLSPEWVLILEKAGYEALHWSEVGDPRATDSAIIAWAVNNDYIIGSLGIMG